MKKILFIYPFMVIGFVLFLTNSCKKDDNNITTPTMETTAVSDITPTTASSGGNITSDGGSTVTARGVCWSTSSSPLATGSHTTDGSGTGAFTSSIAGLTQGTTYYVRAYATNSFGTSFGNEISFTTTWAGAAVTDIDGNVYHTVTIGTQVWMVENLRTTKYSEGSSITNITDNSAWMSQTTGAYCWYNNDISNKSNYGALYNWYTVLDSRNLCPTGWHVPTDDEWTTLENYLGGRSVAGGKLKSTTLWNSPNTGADNSSGFTAFPGGYRADNGPFWRVSEYGYWLSSTESSATNAWKRGMFYNGSNIIRTNVGDKSYGSSVRCLQD